MEAGGRLSGARLTRTGTDGMDDGTRGGPEEGHAEQAGDRGSGAGGSSQVFGLGGDRGWASAGRVSGSLERRIRLAADPVCER